MLWVLQRAISLRQAADHGLAPNCCTPDVAWCVTGGKQSIGCCNGCSDMCALEHGLVGIIKRLHAYHSLSQATACLGLP